VDDAEKYADLILSVGVWGSKMKGERPLAPIEVAHRIQRMVDENSETLHETARRLGLGRNRNDDPYGREDVSQLKCFLNLLKLSPRSSLVLGFGRSDPDKIPFSTGAEIAKLESHDEQDMVIQSVLENGLRKEDAQRIVRYRKAHPDSTIEECIEKILGVKSIQNVSSVICCTLDGSFSDRIMQIKDSLAVMLAARLGGTVSKVKVKGKIIMIFMDDRAFTTLKREQERRDMSFSQYVNSVIGEMV